MKEGNLRAQYRSLERALAELIGPVHFDAEANLRLERIDHLLELLGRPEQSFRSIHVGGTSGKGSTAAMTTAILSAAGLRSGLFLSPAVQLLNECYQIDGRMAATSQLARLFASIRPAIERVARENPFGQPSYFEAQTAMAFCLFREAGVGAAVVEVGLGGETDATNVLPAEVAVLTSVGLDHTNILGHTVEKIAAVKAGIVKAGQQVISGVSQPSVRDIVAARCAEQGANLLQLGQTFNWQPEEGERFAVVLPGMTYSGLCLAMPGSFQRRNAACAVAAAHAFAGGLSEDVVREALSRVTLPGRLEIVQEYPTVILDGAHNPAKMEASAQIVKTRQAGKRRIVVLALKSDKDARAVLCHVVDADTLILTTFTEALWEPTPPETLARTAGELAPGLDIRVVPDPLKALQAALAAAGPQDLVWVTGSLYLVGNVRGYWHPLEKLLGEAGASLTGTPR